MIVVNQISLRGFYAKLKFHNFQNIFMIRLFFFRAMLFAMLLGDVGCLSCTAQSISLSVDSLFQLIDDRSRTIKLKSLCVEDAEESESIARSYRLPTLNASISIGYLGNGYLTDRNFSNGIKIRNPHSNNNFAIEAMQTIYSGGAISGNIHMAELNANITKLDLDQSRQQVRFLLLGWLIDLQCLYNRRHVLDENITLAIQILDNMRARYDEGVVLQSDITRYELQLEDLQLQRAKADEAVRTTNYRLANALDFPVSNTEFFPKLSLIDTSFSIGTENNWQNMAQTSNLSLKKAKLSIDISKTNRKIITADKRPKLSLFAYGHFDSPIVIEVPVLNKNFMYWGFGANMSFNISSLYTTNRRIRQAQIAEMESREVYKLCIENVQDDVQAAYENYRTAITELRTKEKSLELSRQNYEIIKDRFTNGMALITDMVDAANVRLSSEIGLENARTMLLFYYYRLKYITNTL